MSFKVAPKHDFYTGSSLPVSIKATVEGDPLSTSTTLKVALIDTNDSKKESKQLTDAVELTYNSQTKAWEGEFPESETNKLLANPSSPGSVLRYERVVLEIRAGSMTAHRALTVGRGVIE
ncbi:hypothetical protein [Leptothoe spongobia]|uniref:Cadherin domain-containing protein n=1 Tax=Leptothoe spongobia TAU-MAC 1115 TaxID=1967444 RepID=A0A947DG71_9CYAN|nr:hypothetical protein [Leptothoe spongobia]MBT9316276.1 hypothetical protein [Leptothoe spongobia TAU-MAC 1115]